MTGGGGVGRAMSTPLPVTAIPSVFISRVFGNSDIFARYVPVPADALILLLLNSSPHYACWTGLLLIQPSPFGTCGGGSGELAWCAYRCCLFAKETIT